MVQSPATRSSLPIALLALALGAFGIGTTEFVATGLLPQIARDTDVSVPAAGWLVTGYALGVVVGAPLLTVLGMRVGRKQMLIGLMVVFVVGNALTAVAPSFALVVTGRLVASLAHGAFFGIGSVVAAQLVGPRERARAIAVMFTGLTVANVVGVPLGTFVGQHAGWRVTFGIVAAIGVAAVAGVALLVPQAERPADVPMHREFAALRNGQVVLAMAMTVLGFGGVFAAITYIAPLLTDVTGFSSGAVTWLLVVFGLGLVAGNLIGGRWADRALIPVLVTSLAGLAITLALFPLAAHHKAAIAVALGLVGLLGFAAVPPLQKRVLDFAGDAPTLASAVNIGAFNLGNAISAWGGRPDHLRRPRLHRTGVGRRRARRLGARRRRGIGGPRAPRHDRAGRGRPRRHRTIVNPPAATGTRPWRTRTLPRHRPAAS